MLDMKGFTQHPRLLQDILQWDTETWKSALHLWEAVLPQNLSTYTALELGASQGGPSLWLALKGAQVICSDLYNPRPQSQALHERYGVSKRIDYQAIDIRHLPFADHSLDIICCKSVLGGIKKFSNQDPKPHIMTEIQRVLKPGGWFLSADNLYASWLHHQLRQRFIVWSRGWEYFSIETLMALLSGFDTVHYTTAGITALLGRTHAQRQWLGQWENQVQRHIPLKQWARWHYVMATASQKKVELTHEHSPHSASRPLRKPR